MLYFNNTQFYFSRGLIVNNLQSLQINVQNNYLLITPKLNTKRITLKTMQQLQALPLIALSLLNTYRSYDSLGWTDAHYCIHILYLRVPCFTTEPRKVGKNYIVCKVHEHFWASIFIFRSNTNFSKIAIPKKFIGALKGY